MRKDKKHKWLASFADLLVSSDSTASSSWCLMALQFPFRQDDGGLNSSIPWMKLRHFDRCHQKNAAGRCSRAETILKLGQKQLNWILYRHPAAEVTQSVYLTKSNLNMLQQQHLPQLQKSFCLLFDCFSPCFSSCAFLSARPGTVLFYLRFSIREKMSKNLL